MPTMCIMDDEGDLYHTPPQRRKYDNERVHYEGATPRCRDSSPKRQKLRHDVSNEAYRQFPRDCDTTSFPFFSTSPVSFDNEQFLQPYSPQPQEPTNLNINLTPMEPANLIIEHTQTPTGTDNHVHSGVDSLGLGKMAEITLSSPHLSRQNSNELPLIPETSEDNTELFTLPVDDDGNTQLHRAIIEDNDTDAERIIGKAIEFDDLNVPNESGQTPLHLAASSGNARIFRRLMCAGGAIGVLDSDGNTPLHIACSEGHIDVVQHLMKPIRYEETKHNKYDIPFCAIPQDFSLENDDGLTCKQLAENNGRLDIVDLLNNDTDY